ncbi:MAG: hypothetical protein ACREMJ_03350 [Gemmatimonadales bacterium]
MSPIAGVWSLDAPLDPSSPLGAMEAGNGDLRVAAEARVDNRRDLLRALGLDHRAGEIGDAELILRTYEAWGEQCPDRLIGDFAFVLWDRRAHKMLCARDRFGVRPLYYHYRPFELFAVGSEVSGLVTLPGVRRGIFPLPPGHVLAVGPGWARRREYAGMDELTREPSPRPVAPHAVVLNFHP